MKKFAFLLVVLAFAAPARAELITGQITGTFASSGTNVYNQGGVQIVFTGVGPGTIDTPTFASFGTFDVTGAPAIPTAVLDSFTLTLTESAPHADAVSFTGSMAGLLGLTQSSASVTFAPPLVKTLDAGHFVVSVLSADQSTPGRVNLGVPSFPNASIAGSITSVPEPSSLALLGIGSAGLLALIRRRARRLGDG